MAYRLYRTAALIPAFTSLGLILLYFPWDQVFGPPYESEWLTKSAFYPFIFMAVLFNALVNCILSLPIFLVQSEQVKKSEFLRGTCFAFALIWSLSLLFLVLFGFWSNDSVDGLLIALIITIPYLTGLYVSYSRLET